MKTRWNTHRLVTVSLLVALVLTCSTVFAYMFSHTAAVATNFIPAQVSCAVSETFADNVKRNITVTNTSNIPAYLRVRLVTYWIDDDGDVAAVSSDTEGLEFIPGSGWISGSDHTYYYASSVLPNGVTTDLLKGGSITLESKDGFLPVVEVFAEAIQADPTRAAVDSWKVTIEDGKITAAP